MDTNGKLTQEMRILNHLLDKRSLNLSTQEVDSVQAAFGASLICSFRLRRPGQDVEANFGIAAARLLNGWCCSKHWGMHRGPN
jgi:hypothetical protein